MATLTQRTLLGTLKFQVSLAALIFGPALTLKYWQGWFFLFVILACTLPITLYFLRHDPALVERRLNAGPTAERQASQKLIQALAMILICAVVVVSSLDHLSEWSSVPWLLVLIGDTLVILGYAIIFLVFRANSFAAATIQVHVDQTVISSGPYAIVRHPMYAGAVPAIFGTSLALGSWWGLLPATLLVGVIVWRLLDEEAYLARNLSGYQDYQRQVRSRLVPGVW
jgi:protein-S-isoprenylcysteine O-methyltransferase Ste14